MENPGEKRYEKQIMCKECQHPTWHRVLNEAKGGWDDDESGIWESKTFYSLQCLGCDNVCLVVHSMFSEDIGDDGNPELNIAIYPSPYKSDREPIERLHRVPKNIGSVYEETIKAFNAHLIILAAIGVRSTIEAIAIDKAITARGIKTKIEAMKGQGIITEDGAKLLLLVKDIGNLAAHEIKKHHHDDLSLCLDIIEGVLMEQYVLPEEAKRTREIIDGRWERAS